MAPLSLCCVTVSETGRRENNEDSVYGSARLAAVADGVGGAAAGEVASGWAINTLMGLDKRRLTGPLERELRAAVAEANATVRFLMQCRPEWEGMGTTLSAVALSNTGEYVVANVGDSRVYLLRDGRLCRITRDHSLVQELIDRGAISAADARSHPARNVVLQALDGRDDLAWQLDRRPAQIGDRLLLCSDGVSDHLDDEVIARLLSAGSRETAAAALVNDALRAGSRDNVSAVVADVVARTDADVGWLQALPAPGSPSQ